MGELMSPGAIAERNRIHEALRKIAARYQSWTPQFSEPPELTIRRAIEELFEVPIQWEEERKK